MSTTLLAARLSRLADFAVMLAVALASMLLLVYVGYGEASRTYPRFLVEKMMAQGALIQTPLETFLRAGLPLRLHRHQDDAIRTARSGRNYILTTGTGSGSNGGGAVSIARMVSTGIASADSGTGKAAICTGSDGANVISNIGSADGRTVGELVRTATCESTRRRVSACGSGSIVSRMTTGCARTGVIGGGAVGGADEHAANATHVVSAVNGSSVSEYFIECEHRW